MDCISIYTIYGLYPQKYQGHFRCSAEHRPLGLRRPATAQPRRRASGRKPQAAKAAPKRRICRGPAMELREKLKENHGFSGKKLGE